MAKNYPSHRHTPVRHKVKAHTRKGKPVKSFMRGSGSKSTKKVASPTVKAKNKPKGYTVKFKYTAKDTEIIKVIAPSYQDALDEGFEEKEDSRTPIEITVIDPSLGEVIHWAGSRAAEYSKKAAKKAAKKGKEYVKSQYSDYKIKRLIDQAYSSNKSTSFLARSKLKRDHPDVWDIMSISRS